MAARLPSSPAPAAARGPLAHEPCAAASPAFRRAAPAVLCVLCADQKVDLALSKAIQQARLAKKVTQDQLAKQLNIDKKIIAEYENGRAIPNGQVIATIERALGTKLPRPPKK